MFVAKHIPTAILEETLYLFQIMQQQKITICNHFPLSKPLMQRILRLTILVAFQIQNGNCKVLSKRKYMNLNLWNFSEKLVIGKVRRILLSTWQ